jgi:hypothetical protein
MPPAPAAHPSLSATGASAAHSPLPAPAPRRLVLVAVGERPADQVRRYRLARLRVEPRDARDAESRFAHLRRTYD